MTPEMIEACRINPTLAMVDRQRLTELALDGLRFRAWCEGASTFGRPGICDIARLLAECTTAQDYREAIDKFIILRERGEYLKP
jgi:hypothetical protein